ncbi:hypothetical protein L687_01630 [Microbacterium maritypicum MF109]|uniref:Uncharacterized protein n=1 Tax=Microbacterium maritypicum MF109 TaxID=1333857 RepID=T5KIF6_MICMQ|nr:hypothetical protein L687_01630 [Microbacterium maritypicum MF109]
MRPIARGSGAIVSGALGTGCDDGSDPHRQYASTPSSTAPAHVRISAFWHTWSIAVLVRVRVDECGECAAGEGSPPHEGGRLGKQG